MTPISALEGLTTEEAARRLRGDGPNELPQVRQRTLFTLLRHALAEPMFVLLAAAGLVYLLLGDRIEAIALAASIVLVVAITLVQEWRSEGALARLRDLSSPRALVIRDGVERRIAGRELVRGDVVVLREGDRVPADGRLVIAVDLLADESLVSGESVPVEKEAPRPDFIGSTMLAGTLVVRGYGVMAVSATGKDSELGRIGVSLASIEPSRTRLQEQTTRLVRIIGIVAASLCVAVAAIVLARGGSLLDAFLSGITLAMALIPEEFPVVIAVFLALGAWRMARHGVLTRRLSAIEMLGAATVLCCDKTGTLTENRMQLCEIWTAHGGWSARAAWGTAEDDVLRVAALASQPALFDPMERALHEAAQARGCSVTGTPERQYPLHDGFLALATLWRDTSDRAVAAAKGAHETLLEACALSPSARAHATAAAEAAAQRGLRVLAVANAGWGTGSPEDARSFPWHFVGLVAFADSVRDAVPAAVAAFRRAGIRVLMITGDHPETARAIARAAGLDASHVVTGAQLAAMSAPQLAAAAASADVFARVRPEQKLALVRSLRGAGEVVAMTGDGVNDAPALKAADIGVAMGGRGSDVAREAASIVLLQDDFAAMVGTVRLGRRIYENIRNAMQYLVAVHVPLAAMALLPLLLGLPPLLFPLHVVFLEFVIDPACTIVFENEHGDPRLMERPPRAPRAPLFGAAVLLQSTLLGAFALAMVAAVYVGSFAAGYPAEQARAMGFTALVCSNLGLIMAFRSRRLTSLQIFARRNDAAWSVVAITSAALLGAIYLPAAAELLRMAAPSSMALAIAALAGFSVLAASELPKRLRRFREAA